MPGLPTTHSGLEALGPLPWGSHFCQFYRGADDLLDVLVPYFAAGLAAGEKCLWVASEPLPAARVRERAPRRLPGFEAALADGRLELSDARDWYAPGAGFDGDATLRLWIDRLAEALARGYTGVRLTGNTLWLERTDWPAFVAYERAVDRRFRDLRIIALCTYSLEACSGDDLLEVVGNHDFALARRDGRWDIVEAAGIKRAKQDLARANAELESRVAERTAELEDSLRARDAFLSVLAHELRNSLAPIRNAVEVMDRLPAADPRLATLGQMVRRQVTQMSRLVDDLLDAARVAGGGVRLRPERVDLVPLVAQVVEAVAAAAAPSQADVAMEPAAGPVYVDADPVRVTQVVTNLLDNARKFSPADTTISVTVEPSDGCARIGVRDQGVGIAAEQLARVFEPFVQLETTLERSSGGLGIGLTIAKGLVEGHGGRIEAHSAGPGRGAEFSVFLPLADPPPSPNHAAGGATGPARAPARPLRVLVVDDNRDSADSLALLLSMAGHDVRTAYDGPAALEAAAAFEPRVALLDIGLPGLSGLEVARRLRGEARPIVIAAVTGYGAAADREAARAARIDHHLVKPVDPDRLHALLAAATLDG